MIKRVLTQILLLIYVLEVVRRVGIPFGRYPCGRMTKPVTRNVRLRAVVVILTVVPRTLPSHRLLHADDVDVARLDALGQGGEAHEVLDALQDERLGQAAKLHGEGHVVDEHAAQRVFELDRVGGATHFESLGFAVEENGKHIFGVDDDVYLSGN